MVQPNSQIKKPALKIIVSVSRNIWQIKSNNSVSRNTLLVYPFAKSILKIHKKKDHRKIRENPQKKDGEKRKKIKKKGKWRILHREKMKAAATP